MWAKLREPEFGCCSGQWKSIGSSESECWDTRVGDGGWKFSAVIPNRCHLVQTGLNVVMDEEA